MKLRSNEKIDLSQWAVACLQIDRREESQIPLFNGTFPLSNT